jgi:hypothetical protein
MTTKIEKNKWKKRFNTYFESDWIGLRVEKKETKMVPRFLI